MLLAALAMAAEAQAGPCPPQAARDVVDGWSSYRTNDAARAREFFQRAERECPGNLDARTGLGFVMLRLHEPAAAESLFRLVATVDSANADAWTGLAHAANQRARPAEAVRAARRAWALRPDNPEMRELLDQLLPGWDRPAARAHRPDSLVVAARTHGDQFEVPSSTGWRNFYVKGVNLGVALPGRFPSEFPDDSLCYAGWLDTLSNMNANLVRVYTLLPPAFYRALAGWNTAHPERALWLIHGVWAELPPGDDFDHATWKAEFHDEMKRVVDAVHGAAEFPRLPGHAGGRYDVDVSRWTLAYVIGREWEPFAIATFDALHPGSHVWHGRLLEMESGSAADAWMAEQCDFLLGYERDRHHTLRPIAYTNWPTLDPLRHPTEATVAEEKEWRRRLGAPASYKKLEYDNDAVSLDPSLVRATPANPAGWFASYHAYPYYPDFMLHDPGYNRARSSLGRSNFFGYLSELKRHHAGLPVLIAEYGVPSSRGDAHLQPQGWDHGGHDERSMAEIDVRLTRDIHESGMAGGILFAWLDEWFKKNWAVIDLEQPLERTRLWHNVMDPEQNYGVLALDAGPAGGPRLGGPVRPWLALPTLQATAARAGAAPGVLHVGSDPSYLYLAVEFPALGGRDFPWDSAGVQIALDTYRFDLGQKSLPGKLLRSEVGFEFLLDLPGPAAGALQATPEYDPYVGAADLKRGDDRGRFYRRPVRTVSRADGLFVPLSLVSNRARFGRDGTFYPAQVADRGRMRFATADSTSLADWWFDDDAGLLEARVAWGLLNFTDPSSGTVVFESENHGDFGTVRTPGLRIGVATYAKGARPRLLGALPAASPAGSWARASFHEWPLSTWEVPSYHSRLKPAYSAMREAWRDLDLERPDWSVGP